MTDSTADFVTAVAEGKPSAAPRGLKAAPEQSPRTAFGFAVPGELPTATRERSELPVVRSATASTSAATLTVAATASVTRNPRHRGGSLRRTGLCRGVRSASAVDARSRLAAYS